MQIVRVGGKQESVKAGEPQVEDRKVPTSRSVLSPIKSLLRPVWQLISETPDRGIGWAKLAAREGIKIAANQNIDVIYSSGPPHSVHWAARTISRSTGIPWVADFRDPWARRPWKRAQNPLGQKLLPYYERKVVETAKRVILNTPAACEDFQAAYPNLSQKFTCIPNGLDPDLIDQVAAIGLNEEVRETKVLCHPGSMYGHRDPNPILRAIARLNKDGISIKLQQIGAIAEHFDPASAARELGIAHLFERLPQMGHSQVLKHMSDADLLLIIQPDAPLMVPGKVYEMLAFSQPIVAVCDSPATASVVEDGGGWCASSRDETEIATAIKMASSSDRQSIANKRLAARAKYDGRNLTKQLANIFDSAIS